MISPNLITSIIGNIRRGVNTPAFLKTTKTFAWCVLLSHFSLLALHQLPENPLQHQFKKNLLSYVDPFFSQAWTLFAPNPINSNMSLLMRFEYHIDGSVDTTNWIDLTEPLIKIREESFWSPAQRLSKFTQTCMSNVNESHKKIIEHISKTDSLKADTLKAKVFYQKAIATSYGYKSILQYSQYVANNYFSASRFSPEKVNLQYKVLNSRFPRFSKRKLDYYDLSNYEFTELSSSFVEIINHKKI